MREKLSRRAIISRVAHGSAAVVAAQFAGSFGNLAIASTKSPRAVAESYWRVECARDLEKVGQHYHPDAVFNPPGQRLVGWENIRNWYAASFKQFPGLEVEIVHEVTMSNESALEWRAVLIDPAGQRNSLVGVNIVRVEDGRFREVRSYFDSSELKLGKSK